MHLSTKLYNRVWVMMHKDYPVSRVTLFTISINNHFSTKELQDLQYDNGNLYPINQLHSKRKTKVYMCIMKLLATFPSHFAQNHMWEI